MKQYPMPVEPFAEIIERAIFERQIDGLDPDDVGAHQAAGVMTPLDAVTDTLARKMHVSYSAVARNLHRIRTRRDKSRGKVYEVKTISFDWADAIVCCFASPVFWLTDERVSDLYEKIGRGA